MWNSFATAGSSESDGGLASIAVTRTPLCWRSAAQYPVPAPISTTGASSAATASSASGFGTANEKTRLSASTGWYQSARALTPENSASNAKTPPRGPAFSAETYASAPSSAGVGYSGYRRASRAAASDDSSSDAGGNGRKLLRSAAGHAASNLRHTAL